MQAPELLKKAITNKIETNKGSEQRKTAGTASTRAESLAKRIEEGRAIASGKAVTDVTWEVVSQQNCKHAEEQAGVTKSAALELLA